MKPHDMLSFFVITHRTRDYGEHFVVREHRVAKPGAKAPDGFACVVPPNIFVSLCPTAVVLTLEKARAAVPVGLMLLPRADGDDPVIVESWA